MAMHSLLHGSNSVEANVVWWIIVSETLTFSISVIFGGKYFQISEIT